MDETQLIKGKHLGPFNMFPAAPETCPECAVKHEPDEPHNRSSLFYQYHFYNEHGRWPTWEDAMAHCSEETKALWKTELEKRGVKVN